MLTDTSEQSHLRGEGAGVFTLQISAVPSEGLFPERVNSPMSPAPGRTGSRNLRISSGKELGKTGQGPLRRDRLIGCR